MYHSYVKSKGLGKPAQLYEPRHDKTNKITCTQRRLRSAWASTQSDQSSLCDQQVVKGPLFLHEVSEDWCPGWSESLLGAQVILLVLSCRGSYFKALTIPAVWSWSHCLPICLQVLDTYSTVKLLFKYLDNYSNLVSEFSDFYYLCMSGSWQNMTTAYANNKDADQPVHLCSLNSIFVICFIHNVIPIDVIAGPIRSVGCTIRLTFRKLQVQSSVLPHNFRRDLVVN